MGTIFSSHVRVYRKSCCTIVGCGVVGGGVSKMLKFYVKVFYVMGKALSGELSCLQTSLFEEAA